MGSGFSVHDDQLQKVAESTIILRNLHPTPPPHLRRPWNAFIDAVRASIIRSANQCSIAHTSRWAVALKNGFILANNLHADEWLTSGWEHVRSLLYVHLQIHPVLNTEQQQLIVHPTITQTPYHLLAIPPVAGTALTCLPYGTPAYFVAPYSGPTSSLNAQFRDALRGLGVDGWEDRAASYAIVYIPVETHGRGITIIYPSRLVLTLPLSIRPPINPALLPALPAPLQPSPMVAFASAVGNVANGTISSPIAPRSHQLHFPIANTPLGPMTNPNATNAFPTLNSPLGAGFEFNHGLPLPHAPPSTSASASALVPPSTSTSISNPFPFPSSSTWSKPRLSHQTLLRAHRAISTAFRLLRDTDNANVDTETNGSGAGAGAPTPGAVGAPTPGASTVGAMTPGSGSAPTPTGNSTTSAGFIFIPSSTTSTQSLSQTAAEVSAYVDYVAREREKERERLREAQAQQRLGAARSNTSINANASVSGSGVPTRSVPPISIPNGQNPTLILPTTTAIPVPIPPDAQMFYPSPPTNPPSVSASGAGPMSPMVQVMAQNPIAGPLPLPLPLPLPQLPQGLPSMHDASTNKRAGQGAQEQEQMEPAVPVLENSTENILIKTERDPTTPPLLPPSTSEGPGPGVAQPAPASAPAVAGTNTHDSTWSNYSNYFGGGDSMDMELDGMGMGSMGDIMNMGMGSDNNMSMDMDMALFGGAGDGSFDLNLDNLGSGMDWNMDSTFGFGSGAPVPPGNASGTGSGPGNQSSFPSFNGFSQPMPPPMTRAVTAPTSTQTQVKTQAQQNPSKTTDWEEAFTDDDFSFFDHKPSLESSGHAQEDPLSMISPPPPPASAPPTINPNPNPNASSPDPLAFFVNHDDSSSFFTSLGLGIPALNPASALTPTPYDPSHHIPNPHTPGGLGLGGFTPSPPDEVDPNSSSSSGSTYQVQLEQGRLAGNVLSPLSSLFHPSPAPHARPHTQSPKDKDKKFAPIPFAKSHSLADGKYKVAGGKFALLKSSSSGGWKSRLGSPYRYLTSPGTAKSGKRDELEPGRWTLPSPPMDSDGTNSSDDEDLTVIMPKSPPGPSPAPSDIPLSTTIPRRGWRPRYDRATDPRIGVVRKLTGHKSKKQQAIPREHRRRQLRWMRNWEEETGTRRHADTDRVQSEDDEEMEDDDDEVTADEDDVEEQDEEIGNTAKKSGRRERSRPATPLPAYLPPGPALVATCFHWIHLVDMAGGEPVPTPSEGMIPEPYQAQLPPYHTGIHGVPTPVSPATLTGMSTAASPAFAPTPGPTNTPSADADPDKDHASEATASAIARECVENCLWLDSWNTVEGLVSDSEELGADSSLNHEGMKAKWSMDRSADGVWPIDVLAVKELLVGSKVLGNDLLSIGDVFAGLAAPSSSSTLIPLSPPLLSVAKSEAIIHIMPTALRFWDKLGLGPKGGKKNVTVFVIHGEGLDADSEQDSASKWRDEQIERWLRNTTELYKAKQFGEMVLGTSTLCQKDGIVPLQFDLSFRKNLAAFIASLPTPQDSFVFFILTPISAMTLASETVRHLFSAVKEASIIYSEAQIHFQFVPEPQILNMAVHPSSPQDFCSESFVRSLYDRILMPVDRAMSRKFFEHGKRVKTFLQVPTFTLARLLSENKVSYSGSTDPSLDVLDRHTFLHVGYQVSSCGRWILAACIDQRGEAHDLGVWSTQPHLHSDKDDDKSGVDGSASVVSDEMYVVGKVWDFAIQFAENANVEWRIVFAKLGTMGAVELDAWMTHLCTALHSISKNAQAPVHVSLLCVEPSAPWIMLPMSSQSPSSPHPGPTKSSSSRSVSGSKTSSKTPIFIDTSTVTYSLFQKDSISIPVGVPPTLNDIGLASDVVINNTLLGHPMNDDDHLIDLDDIPLVPLSSSALVRMPCPPPHSYTDSDCPTTPLARMIRIHLLYAAKSEGSAYPTVASGAADGHQSLLREITNSFYSLSVLSSARGGGHGVNRNSLLPFHLSAVETMRNALSAHTRNGADSQSLNQHS